MATPFCMPPTNECPLTLVGAMVVAATVGYWAFTESSFLSSGPFWCCPEGVYGWRGDCSHVIGGQIGSLLPWLFHRTPLRAGELRPCEAHSCSVSILWASEGWKGSPLIAVREGWGVTQPPLLQGWHEEALDAAEQSSWQHLWRGPGGPPDPESAELEFAAHRGKHLACLQVWAWLWHKSRDLLLGAGIFKILIKPLLRAFLSTFAMI